MPALAVTISILDSERPPGDSQLDVVELSRGQRIKRALAHLGIAWAAALGAIAVPLLHFVLVPGLAIAGPVVAAIAFHSQVRALPGTQVHCPKCQAGFALETVRYGWPLRANCPSCGAMLSAAPR